MTRVAPVSFPITDEARPDALATAAMRALTREHPMPPPWGAAKSVFLGAITFGVLPLYSWPRSFRTVATIERQQLWHLAEWVRLCGGHAGTDGPPVLPNRAGFRPLLWACSMLCVAVTAAVFAYQAAHYGFNVHDLRATTYGIGQLTPHHLPFDVARQLFITWSVGMSLAYTLHWFHLHLHHAEVRRFVEAFNGLTKRQGIRPVSMPPLGLGVRPVWLLGMIALVSVGAVWAIPMCLAGALQCRWKKQSRAVRGGLSDAVRQVLMLRRPALHVRRPFELGEFCPNDLCVNRVPPQAAFCPGCGMPVSSRVAEVDKVA
jgi:hypothetical protein